MNREEICQQLTEKINNLKDKENNLNVVCQIFVCYTVHSPERVRR